MHDGEEFGSPLSERAPRARTHTHTHTPIPPLPYVAYQFVSTDLNFPSIKFLSEPCSVLN